jgi:general secretion pathway protein I
MKQPPRTFGSLSSAEAIRALGRPRGTCSPRRRAEAGFSLLEVLAAFVILALVATALFRLFSGSLLNVSAADEWSRALLLAESQLDLAASARPLMETTERGQDSTGTIQWESRVVAYAPPDTSPDLQRAAEMLGTRLFRVTTDVKFPGALKGERTLSLSTLKLAQRVTTP